MEDYESLEELYIEARVLRDRLQARRVVLPMRSDELRIELLAERARQRTMRRYKKYIKALSLFGLPWNAPDMRPTEERP